MASDFPNKPQEDNLEAELVYTKQLMAVIEKHDELLAVGLLTQTNQVLAIILLAVIYLYIMVCNLKMVRSFYR